MAASKNFPAVFGRFWMQILHFVGIPVFFVAFSLVYTPFFLMDFMGVGPMDVAFNLVMSGCILLIVLVGTRLALYFMWKSLHFTLDSYLLWCIAEMFVSAMFLSLYFSLMQGGEPYFHVLGKCFRMSFGILVFPYLILLFVGYSRDSGSSGVSDADETLIRFKDSAGKLKLAISPQSILFVEAEENYVHIHYLDGARIKDFVLRSSMKNVEETVSSCGIVRCHRSFLVNPQHISMLRKDRELGVLVDFDAPSAKSIPVSKSYYDSITRII